MDHDEHDKHTNQGSEPGERADATGGGRYAPQLHYWFIKFWRCARLNLLGRRGPLACAEPHPELRLSRCQFAL